jgi:MFS family permease
MFTAVPIVALLAWQLVPLKIFGLDGWRWVVIIGSLGALPIWWIRRRLPESPRWLAQHGRTAEAERIVLELEKEIQAETGTALPAPETLASEGRVQDQDLDRNVQRRLSRPHPHAGDLQSVPDHGLLRLFQLGPHLADLARRRGHVTRRSQPQ